MGIWSDLKELFEPITSKIEWFGKQIQKVVNCILLLIVYFTGVAFTSISAKIMGKKFLDLNPDRSSSYWIEEETITKPREEYKRMF